MTLSRQVPWCDATACTRSTYARPRMDRSRRDADPAHGMVNLRVRDPEGKWNSNAASGKTVIQPLADRSAGSSPAPRRRDAARTSCSPGSRSRRAPLEPAFRGLGDERRRAPRHRGSPISGRSWRIWPGLVRWPCLRTGAGSRHELPHRPRNTFDTANRVRRLMESLSAQRKPRGRHRPADPLRMTGRSVASSTGAAASLR